MDIFIILYNVNSESKPIKVRKKKILQKAAISVD